MPKPLSEIDYKRSLKFLWSPPVDRSPDNFQRMSFYDSERTGKRSYVEYLERPKPDLMDIDSGEPAQPENSTPQQRGYVGIDTDGDGVMGDAPPEDGRKRVHWTPTEGDKRPRSAGSGALEPENRKPSLASRIDSYNQITEEEGGEYPKVPSPCNFDVEDSYENLNIQPQAVISSTKPLVQHTLERDWNARYQRTQEIERHRQLNLRAAQYEYDQLQARLNARFSSPQGLSTPDQVFGQPRAGTPSASPQNENPLLQSRISPPNTSPNRKIIAPKPRLSPNQRSPPVPQVQDLYPSLQNHTPQQQHIPTPPPEEDNQDVVRKIRGMVVSLCSYVPSLVPSLFTAVWVFFSGARLQTKSQEIVAVETSLGSGKRRAVALEDLEKNLLAPTGGNALPGYYSAPSPLIAAPISTGFVTMNTPPDSRPQSRSSQEGSTKRGVESEVQTRQLSRPVEEMDPVPSVAPAPRPRRIPHWEMPNRNVSYSQRGTMNSAEARKYASLFGRDEPYVAPPEKRPLWKTSKAPKESIAYFEERKKKAQARDAQIDALIDRTKRVTLEPLEQQKLRKSIRTKKQRDADLKAQQQAAKQAKKAEEAAKIKAEEEAEKARKKAEQEEEEEARIRAAEEAARKATKEPLIPPLSSEWSDKITAAMANANPQAVLAKTSLGVELKRYDLGCILPQEGEISMKLMGGRPAPSGWLNDEGVNGFLSAIVSRKLELTGYVKSAKTVPAFAFYDAAWYSNYKDKGVKGIQTWSRRKGIKGEKLFECERVFFPVNTGAHWILLIIKPKERTFDVLDSAGGSRKTYFKIAREWLQMELGALYNAAEWKESDAKSEYQQNNDDCGVFTCINALASARGYDYNDVQASNKMTDARKAIVAVLLNEGFEGVLDL